MRLKDGQLETQVSVVKEGTKDANFPPAGRAQFS